MSKIMLMVLVLVGACFTGSEVKADESNAELIQHLTQTAQPQLILARKPEKSPFVGGPTVKGLDVPTKQSDCRDECKKDQDGCLFWLENKKDKEVIKMCSSDFQACIYTCKNTR